MGDSGSPRVPEFFFALLIQIIKMGDSGSPRVPACLFIIATCSSSRTPVPEFALTLPGLFLQATHDRRSQLFQLLLLEHLKLKNEFVAAEAESMQREERHAAQVDRLQEQLDRRVQLFDVLKKDLDAATEAKSKSDKQLETARNALKERALHDQELKTQEPPLRWSYIGTYPK